MCKKKAYTQIVRSECRNVLAAVLMQTTKVYKHTGIGRIVDIALLNAVRGLIHHEGPLEVLLLLLERPLLPADTPDERLLLTGGRELTLMVGDTASRLGSFESQGTKSHAETTLRRSKSGNRQPASPTNGQTGGPTVRLGPGQCREGQLLLENS